MRTILSSSLDTFRSKVWIFILFNGISVWILLCLICWSTGEMFSLKKRTSLAQDLIQILNVTTQKISTARPFEPTDQFDSGLFVVSLRGSVYPESVYFCSFCMKRCDPNIWGFNIMYTRYTTHTCDCPRWSVYVLLMFSDKVKLQVLFLVLWPLVSHKGKLK